MVNQFFYETPCKNVYTDLHNKKKFTTCRHCGYSYTDNTIGNSKIKNINYIRNNERSYFAIDIYVPDLRLTLLQPLNLISKIKLTFM